MMAARKKHIPHFETDEEAAEFWDTHSLTDYLHELEPVENVTFGPIRMKQVCLRLLPGQVEHLKRIAARKGIGYQTMLRMWITERVRQEDVA
jgi:predicted DNA binding CopG/RHH family protein